MTASTGRGAYTACGSCGAVAPAATEICPACGVVLEAFEAATSELRAVQRRQTAETARRFAASVADADAREVRQARRRLSLQLGFAALVAILVLGAGGVVLAAREWRHRIDDARVRELKTVGEQCMAAEQYACARIRLAAYVKERPADRDGAAKLAEARYRLALWYDSRVQWELAIDELDALLDAAPGDERARALRDTVFDHWSADARARGDWGALIRIRLRQSFGFR